MREGLSERKNGINRGDKQLVTQQFKKVKSVCRSTVDKTVCPDRKEGKSAKIADCVVCKSLVNFKKCWCVWNLL